jgi:polyphosphate kinase
MVFPTRYLKSQERQHAPWHVVHSDDKKRARLNCISHILNLIPYKKIHHKKIKLPKRSHKGRYDDRTSLRGANLVPEKY